MRRTPSVPRARAIAVFCVLVAVLSSAASANAAVTGAGIVLDKSGLGDFSSVDVGDRYAVMERYVAGDVDVVAYDLTAPPPAPEIIIASTPVAEAEPTVSGGRVAWKYDSDFAVNALVADTIPLSTPTGFPINVGWDYLSPVLWGDRCVYALEDDADGAYDIWISDVTEPDDRTLVTGLQAHEFNPDIWRNIVVWQHENSAGSQLFAYAWLGDMDVQYPHITAYTGDRVRPSVWGEWIVWEDHTSADWDIVALNVITGETTEIGHDGAWDGNPSVFDDRVVYTSQATDLSSASVYVCDLSTGVESEVWQSGAGVLIMGDTTAFNRYVGWWDATPSLDVYVAELDITLDVEQLEGPNRYETAIEISKAGWPNGSADVLIATGENFPDALGGAALAGTIDCPILLSVPTTLPAEVEAELVRLSPNRVYILGGVGAVADGVQQTIEQALPAATVERLEGADRYGTARAVVDEAYQRPPFNSMKTAFVATGANFPDALAVSPLAAALEIPIYLAEPDGISQANISSMQAHGVEEVYMVGGSDVVSTLTEDRLKDAFGTAQVRRIAGQTRYETATEIAQFAVEDMPWMEYCGVTIATGENFPDALTGGVLAGTRGTVMLLTRSAALTPATRTVLMEECAGTPRVTFFGGEGAIGDSVIAEVRAAVK